MLGSTEQGAAEQRLPLPQSRAPPPPHTGAGALSTHTPESCVEMNWGLEVTAPLLSLPAAPCPSLGTSTPGGAFVSEQTPSLVSVVQGPEHLTCAGLWSLGWCGDSWRPQGQHLSLDSSSTAIQQALLSTSPGGSAVNKKSNEVLLWRSLDSSGKDR